MAKKTPPAEKAPSFENALERLEEVVEEMEAGDLSLDQMITRFEEGTQLSRQCEKRLSEVEQKIEQLVRKADELETEPFNPED